MRGARFFICAVFLAALSCSRSEPTPAPEKPVVAAPAEAIHLTTLSETFQAPGTVRASSTTVLSSRVTGQIISLSVREGDAVRQGQTVAKIEHREASARLRRADAGVVEAKRSLEEAEAAIRASQAAVQAAETNRDLAVATRNRYDVLRERRSISAQEFNEVDSRSKAAADQVQSALEGLAASRARRLQTLARIEQAEAERESATAALDDATVFSPVGGIVTRRAAEPGMLATPGLQLLVIESTDQYDLEVAVEESRAFGVRVGQSVQVEVDALEGSTLTGTVREISPLSDSATRTYAVKVKLANMPRGLAIRSGLFGRAFFPAGKREALVVPQSALVRRGQLEGIYIVEEGVAVFRLVTVGKLYEEGIEILSGLDPGMRILSNPTLEIHDGVRVAP